MRATPRRVARLAAAACLYVFRRRPASSMHGLQRAGGVAQ